MFVGVFLLVTGSAAEIITAHALAYSAAQMAFLISGCIGIAMFVAMILSSLFGTVIPIFFKKIKVDPAVASGPLITTVNDLIAVVTYYGLAWLLIINFAL